MGEVAGGGQAGTFVQSPLADTQFAPGERLIITAPDVSDATAAGLSVTIAAKTGAVSP